MMHPTMPNGIYSAALSSFNVLDLSPVLFLDSSDASTLAAMGNSLTTWLDKSGNGYHASQTIGANKPQTGTRLHNGLNVIDFTAANSQYMLTSSFSAALSQPNTLYCVGKYDATSSHYLMDGITDSQRHVMGQINGNDAILAGSVLAGVATNTNPHILGASFNISSSAFRRDGVVIASGDAGSQQLSGLTIGARRWITNFHDGWIGSIILFDRLLDATETVYLESGLSAQWGISI